MTAVSGPVATSTAPELPFLALGFPPVSAAAARTASLPVPAATTIPLPTPALRPSPVATPASRGAPFSPLIRTPPVPVIRFVIAPYAASSSVVTQRVSIPALWALGSSLIGTLYVITFSATSQLTSEMRPLFVLPVVQVARVAVRIVLRMPGIGPTSKVLAPEGIFLLVRWLLS